MRLCRQHAARAKRQMQTGGKSWRQRRPGKRARAMRGCMTPAAPATKERRHAGSPSAKGATADTSKDCRRLWSWLWQVALNYSSATTSSLLVIPMDLAAAAWVRLCRQHAAAGEKAKCKLEAKAGGKGSGKKGKGHAGLHDPSSPGAKGSAATAGSPGAKGATADTSKDCRRLWSWLWRAKRRSADAGSAGKDTGETRRCNKPPAGGAALTQEARGKTQGKLDAAQAGGREQRWRQQRYRKLAVDYAKGLGRSAEGAAMPLACSTNEKAKAKLRGKGGQEKGQGPCGAA